MDLKELQKNWDRFARTDPMWSIRTWPNKLGNRWQADEFFLGGKEDIAAAMAFIESLSIQIGRGKALDFGCGLGRLTQPLCEYFDEVYGVDIAPRMIELAKEFNRFPNKCKYYLNENDHLEVFPDNEFDLIYTDLTLQHMEPQYARRYIEEFLRILAANGVLVFELPGKPQWIVKEFTRLVQVLISAYFKCKHGVWARMEMYGMPEAQVTEFIEGIGARIVATEKREILDRRWFGGFWRNCRYFIVKQ